MKRIKSHIIPLFFLIASPVFAGSFYSSPSLGGALATSVSIENKGIYNLVISVEFLKEPFDRSPYTSDNYEEMIQRLNVEWRGVALKRVLESNSYNVSDLAVLKKKVDIDLSNLVSAAKKKHGVTSDSEVVYSIGSFYLVNLNNE